jgi:RpiR family glv operon transcriptional regulator
MNLASIVDKVYTQLTHAEIHIAKYLIAHQDDIGSLSILELSRKCNSNKTTVHRLIKKLGFGSYFELKYLTRETLTDEDNNGYRLVDAQLQDIQATQKLLKQSNLQYIVQSMRRAKGMYGFGTGSGQHNALRDLNRNLMYLGHHIAVIPAKRELDIIVPTLGQDNLMIIASLSGETQELKENILTLNSFNVPILSITSMSSNFLARHSMHNLYYTNMVLTTYKNNDVSSLIALNVVCDSIYREFVNQVCV